MDTTIWGNIMLTKFYSPITYDYTQYVFKTVKYKAKKVCLDKYDYQILFNEK